MKVLVRTDASYRIGSGHVMRCLALAAELQNRGDKVFFVCRESPGWLGELVKDSGHTLFSLPRGSLEEGQCQDYFSWLGEPPDVDARQTIELCAKAGPFDWLIIDHYAIDILWEQKLRCCSEKIMVIDDLINRHHDCDLLLNQNLQIGFQKSYSSLLPEHCEQLLGPKFALLRSTFRKKRLTNFKRKSEWPRLFVFLGGSDPDDYTSLVIRALELLPVGSISADIVVGASNSKAETLRLRCNGIPGLNFYQQVPDIEELMAQADLAICSAGCVTWERSCLGLPAITLAIAENQSTIGINAAEAGLSLHLGDAKDLEAKEIASAIAGLLDSKGDLTRMSSIGLSLVDGLGVSRVVCAMIKRPLNVAIVSDLGSWITPWIDQLTSHWQKQGHRVVCVNEISHLPESDLAFYLSCSQLASRRVRARAMHNLVVHESALPEGRGWAPLTWQILAGQSEVPVVMIEAEDKVDSGDIYLRETIEFCGHELCNEIRQVQGRITKQLCINFVDEFPGILSRATRQKGEISVYPRRTPEDSRLDPDRSLREQFNLLRVVDNIRYPAFFELNGHRYELRIDRQDSPNPEVKTV